MSRYILFNGSLMNFTRRYFMSYAWFKELPFFLVDKEVLGFFRWKMIICNRLKAAKGRDFHQMNPWWSAKFRWNLLRNFVVISSNWQFYFIHSINIFRITNGFINKCDKSKVQFGVVWQNEVIYHDFRTSLAIKKRNRHPC